MRLLRLRYSFNMVEAYLAQMMGDNQSMNHHLDQADKIKGDIVLEILNARLGLFD
jgi:hypothetical protein